MRVRTALTWCARLSQVFRHCGRSSMVERQLPKLDTRVRFPSPALGWEAEALLARGSARPSPFDEVTSNTILYLAPSRSCLGAYGPCCNHPVKVLLWRRFLLKEPQHYKTHAAAGATAPLHELPPASGRCKTAEVPSSTHVSTYVGQAPLVDPLGGVFDKKHDSNDGEPPCPTMRSNLFASLRVAKMFMV